MTWASPRTSWSRSTRDVLGEPGPRALDLRGLGTRRLGDVGARDEKGFILTGRDLDASAGLVSSSVWPLTRAPQMLETSLPGVFAVGDVRAGNVKRVASAVGEGAISISLVHRALAEF